MANGFGETALFLQYLPEILSLMDIIFYFFGFLFFGWIVMMGFRGQLHFALRFAVKMVMGAVSMIAGIGIGAFFPGLNEGLFGLFNAGLLAGSLVAAIILGVAVFLITFRLVNVAALQNMIQKLQKRIRDADNVPPKKRGIRDPVKIVGIVIILGILVVSVFSFRGFPLISGSFANFIGFTPEELQAFGNQLAEFEEEEQNLPPGCIGAFTLAQQFGAEYDTLPRSANATVEGWIEAGTGSPVLDMRIIAIDGQEHILGVTEDSQICSASQEQFCNCITTPGL